MTGCISFSVPVQPDSDFLITEKKVEMALKSAWTRLRFDHPTIASRVQYDTAEQKYKKIYETFPDSASQHQWLDDTFRVVPEIVSGVEWCNSDPPVPALPTLFLLKSPTSKANTFCADLVLRSHHDIIDGMGTLLLFNNLLSFAADIYEQAQYELPSFGEEWSNLSPPLRIAAGIPATLSPEHEEQMRAVLKHNAALKEGIETASPPFRRQNPLPGKHQRVALTLSEMQRPEFWRNVAVSGSASHTRTMPQLRWLLGTYRNARKPSACTSTHPATVYHSVSGRSLAVDLTVPAMGDPDNISTDKEEFLPVAQHIRGYYLDIRDDVGYINLIPAFWAMSISPYPGPDPPTIPARNENPSVSISSMGVLDKAIRRDYGSFSVDDPWVTGEELGTGLGAFLGTWKGRLTFSAAYNDAWHGKEDVLGILSQCNDIVFGGLGITEPTLF